MGEFLMDENLMANISMCANAALRRFSNRHFDCRVRGAGTYCRICELTPNFAMRFRKLPPIHRLQIAGIRASQQVFKVMEF
jgi:hypothetical protein